MRLLLDNKIKRKVSYMFDVNEIGKALIKKYDSKEVDLFCNYCVDLLNARKKGVIANPWMNAHTNTTLVKYFEQVKIDGMLIDGKHITIQKTGVTYDYVAYKNKMLKAYPESIVDLNLVFNGDTFDFQKKSGKVFYTHEIKNPFNQNEKNMIGGYCVVKNKRGEFLTTLGIDEINKHRKVAKTDSIWSKWFMEMAKKTIIKKACKLHFDDIFQNIETIDNENCDLELPLNIPIEVKKEIECISSYKLLEDYYKANKGKYNKKLKPEFNKLIANKQKELKNADS